MSRRRIPDAGLGVNLSLIITPMLDMAFQLMAFFIMTFQPLSQEENLTGVLLPPPKEERKKEKKKEEKKAPEKGVNKPKDGDPTPMLEKDKEKPKEDEPKDKEPDTKDDPLPKDLVRVIVEAIDNPPTAEAKGKLGRILLKFPEDATPQVVMDLDDRLDSGLKKVLKRLEGWSGKDGGKIQLEASPELRYGYFIQVQDMCRQAKYREMGFAKPVRPKK